MPKETTKAATSRRFLVALGAGVLLAVASGCDSTAELSRGAETLRRPEGLAYDVIDGRVVVATRAVERASVARGYGLSLAPFGAVNLTVATGLDWEVLEGEARIFEDPLSGDTIFEPQGDIPVVVRPRLGGVPGPPLDIGIDPRFLPADQGQFLASGGGACAANPNHAGLFSIVGTEPFEIDVRSVVNTSVMPRSLDRRSLVYQHALYYGWSPQAGPLRVRHNPSRVSRTELASLTNDTAEFFPASAESRLYFIIDFIDHGVSVFNKDPMVLTSSSTGWPPFRSPQATAAGQVTRFFHLERPEVQMMEIRSQEMYVYPTKELAVETASFAIDPRGELKAVFTIENRTESPARARWFLLGDYAVAGAPVEGLVELLPRGSAEVLVRARVDAHLLTQFVTLGVVSETEPRMTGSRRVEFRFPQVSTARAELLGES